MPSSRREYPHVNEAIVAQQRRAGSGSTLTDREVIRAGRIAELERDLVAMYNSPGGTMPEMYRVACALAEALMVEYPDAAKVRPRPELPRR